MRTKISFDRVREGLQEVAGEDARGVLLGQRHGVLEVDHHAVGLEDRDVLQHAGHVAGDVEQRAPEAQPAVHAQLSSKKRVSTPPRVECWRSTPSTMYSPRMISQVAKTSASHQVAADRLAGRLRREDVQVRVHLAGLGRHEVALEAEQVERTLEPVHRHARLGDRQARARLDVAELDVAHRADGRHDGAVAQFHGAREAQQLVDQLRARQDADDEAPPLAAFPV